MSDKLNNNPTHLQPGKFESIESDIPPRLMAGASEFERETTNTINTLEQKAALAHENDQILDQAIVGIENGQKELGIRVGSLEENQKRVIWGWKTISLLAVGIGGAISFVLKLMGAFK